MSRTHSIAVIGGDGIGPDVTDAALLGVAAAARRFGFATELTDYRLGADLYLRTGEVLTEDVVAALRGHDAMFLGALGDPRVRPGILERGLVVALRVLFRQGVNLRPVRLYPGVRSPIAGLTPERCDLVILRENTEGLYAGGGSTVHGGTRQAVALQHSVTTVPATEEIVEYGFRLAEQRRRKLTLCHKTNILVEAGALWEDVVDRLSARHPGVELDYVHVDAMCQHLPTTPERFDVVVTDNLFGDIISDLGATVQGGLGVAASGNLNVTGSAPSMFEPVHGSAPDIAGQGLANPAAAALSAALMLASLGESRAALVLEAATAEVLAGLPALAGSEMGASTRELGERIAERVETIAVPESGGSLLEAMAAVKASWSSGG